jgi:TetR/AcrR family transcriptional regulator
MEVERLTRKEREKLSHRSQIIADALELFKEKGYHNVSMHEIAAKAEFSIGTLYKYFRNKEDLYSALVIEKAEEVSRIVDEVLSRGDDVEMVVRDYIDVKIKVFKDNLAMVRLLFVETQKGISFNDQTGFCKVLRELHQREMTRVASLLEKGIRQKKFKKLDPYHLSLALGGLLDGFVFNWLEDPDSHPYAANADFILELFFNGCLAAGKSMRPAK